MQRYLADRSRNWRIVETRQLQTGQVVDYVDARTYLPKSPNAPYAEPPTLIPDRVKESEPVDFGWIEPPPPDTVSVFRPNLESYLESGGELTVREYLSRQAQPTPNHQNNRLYARHRDNITLTETGGVINVWNYGDVATGSQFSLVQGGAFCGSGGTLEGIELGVQKYRDKYSDNNIHIFTYFRTAGTATGDHVGGYNYEVAGYVPAVGASLGPTSIITNSSVVGGAQVECQFEIDLYQGNWWVYACHEWMGYYPTVNSELVDEDDMIEFDLIDEDACWAQWYGEVWDASPSTWTNANMGSGEFASAGFGDAAWIRNPWTGTPSVWTYLASDATWPSGYDAGCYTETGFSNLGSGWEHTFFLGGPGGNAAGCN